jgi:hypothetical protein
VHRVGQLDPAEEPSSGGFDHSAVRQREESVGPHRNTIHPCDDTHTFGRAPAPDQRAA